MIPAKLGKQANNIGAEIACATTSANFVLPAGQRSHENHAY
jgi:hypothetical protein